LCDKTTDYQLTVWDPIKLTFQNNFRHRYSSSIYGYLMKKGVRVHKWGWCMLP